MNFDLDEQQEELIASVRAVLEQECPPELARSLYEGGGVPEQPWRSACELGWTALTTPESAGGLGLGAIELGLIAEQHGRFLATGPMLATLSQWIPALCEAASHEQKQRFLEPAAQGLVTGVLAATSASGDATGTDPGLRAHADGDDWLLEGSRHFVYDLAGGTGPVANEVVAAAVVAEGDGIGLFIVPGDAARVERFRNLDASRPLAHLSFDGVRVPPDRVLGTPGRSAAALERVTQQATVAIGFEMVGTAQALFDLTLDYAKQREQFGQPIGSFQAIQHKFADCFIELEKARSIAYYAAMTLDEDDPSRTLATHMLKAAIGGCQSRLCKEGIQIHGGLGYTWEQDVHLYVKRLKAGDAMFGTTAFHQERIAGLLGV